MIPLNGTAIDGGDGPTVSGVASVDVWVSPDGDGWQAAQITPTGNNQVDWTIEYLLPNLGRSYPTGEYEVKVRATDGVGNRTAANAYFVGSLRLDSSPPTISLNPIPDNYSANQALPVISREISIGGVISETDTIQTGIASAEIAYKKKLVTQVYSDTLLLLLLDDLPGLHCPDPLHPLGYFAASKRHHPIVQRFHIPNT